MVSGCFNGMRAPVLDGARERHSSCGMRSTIALAVLTLALSLTLPRSASATVTEALSLRDLTQRADLVVLATAVAESARRDARGRIVTDVALRIEEALKGDARAGSTITMTRLGGAIGDIGMRVEGEPRFTVGERYVVFLYRTHGGALRPVGMSQGVMPVDDDGGETMVLPGGAGLSLVERVAGGRLAPAPGALIHAMPYLELRDRVGVVIEGEQSGAVRP